MLLPRIYGGIFLDEKETQHSNQRKGNHKDRHRCDPASCAGGKPAHDDGKQRVDQDRACHGNNAAVGRHFRDQHLIVAERPDGIGRICRAAEGGKNGKHQRIHAENPRTFKEAAPFRACQEQSHGANRNADDTKLIGTPFSQLRMGIIHQPACKNIGEPIDDFTRQQQSAQDCRIDPQRVRTVQGQVPQDNGLHGSL